jgi:molybdopterin-binding protein
VERVSPADPVTGRFAARFTSQGLVLEVVAEREGEAFAVLRPADLALSRGEPAGPAPRNRFSARVTRIERETAIAQVHLAVSRTQLMAAVMAITAEELGLAPGVEVQVAIKATAVHLI